MEAVRKQGKVDFGVVGNGAMSTSRSELGRDSRMAKMDRLEVVGRWRFVEVPK